MKSKFFNLRLLVTLIAWLALLMPTAKLKADNSPLCFTARNGTVIVRFYVSERITHTLQCSSDGINWRSYPMIRGYGIILNANEKVYFRAEYNQTTANNAFGYYDPNDEEYCSKFKFTSNNGGTVEGSGNIMSLYGPNCPNLSLSDDAFANLFNDCSLLTTAPELPATNLGDRCYYSMFQNCTSLLSAPDLPATTLEDACYESMFSGCTALKTIPSLPSTTLKFACYRNMFSGCSSLKVNSSGVGKKWSIPAGTTSAFQSLVGMFSGTGGNFTGDPTIGTTYYIGSDQAYIPLCFTAKNGNVTIRFNKMNVPQTIEYSTNGTNWNYYTSNTDLVINANCKVYFRSRDNETTAIAFGNSNYFYSSRFVFTSNNGGTVEASGNIMSLYGPDFPDLQLQPYAFANMFESRSILTTAPIIPSTKLATDCYKFMFKDCTSLIKAPELPATSLFDECYLGMFYGCTSLNTPPSLPATSLASSCYSSMFYGCSSLMNAPALPATSLVNSCYSSMFANCSSLTTAPALQATTLASYCYSNMFYSCTSLITTPALPATTLAERCYNNMFKNCTSLTAAPALPATTLATYCYCDMFNGCTSLTTAPTLPAPTLHAGCYFNMFNGCTSLTTAPAALPATTLATICYGNMFEGCTSLTSAPVLPATTLASHCYYEMFIGCTSLTTAPALPATTLAFECYHGMFSGCTSLTSAPALPATTLASDCYYDMFNGCTSLTTAPTLPATTLNNYCYYKMFFGCTSLTSVPALPATNLDYIWCYREMFRGCASLIVNTTAPGTEWIIPATMTTADALTDMFYGTSGTMNSTPSVNTTYYIASGSTKTTSGDGDWNNPTKWPNGKIPGGADDVTISSNITIPEGVNAHCESINITGSGVLTVAPSATLHATTITNSDPEKFIIQADSASTGTVRFTSGSPKVTVQMCLKGSYEEGTNGNLIPDWQYRGFIGTPDASQTLRDIVIYKWDETNNNVNCWGNSAFYNGFNNKTATGTFTPWDGFSVANFDTAKAIRSYTTTLLPTNVDHTYNLTMTTTGNGHQDAQNCGLNLLTNSYSAPINMSAGVSGTNIQSTFYFFNTRTNSEYNSDKSAAITTYPTASGSYLQATSPYIAAGQSFGVKATADGASLTIPATAVSTVSSGAMYAPAKKPGMVKIMVESEEAIDEVYLLQMDECTSGFDNGFDGTKVFSTKAHQIYAQNEYGQTAVNADRTLLGQFVGFKPMVETEHAPSVQMTIAAIDIEGYDELYLYDYVTDKYIEITDEESSYTFTSTSEETPRRFQIVGKSSDGTEYNPKAEPRIEVVGEEIYLMNFERGDAMVILTDAAGRTLWSVNAKDGNTFTLPHLAAGVYFVSCGKTTAKYVQH